MAKKSKFNVGVGGSKRNKDRVSKSYDAKPKRKHRTRINPNTERYQFYKTQVLEDISRLTKSGAQFKASVLRDIGDNRYTVQKLRALAVSPSYQPYEVMLDKRKSQPDRLTISNAQIVITELENAFYGKNSYIVRYEPGKFNFYPKQYTYDYTKDGARLIALVNNNKSATYERYLGNNLSEILNEIEACATEYYETTYEPAFEKLYTILNYGVISVEDNIALSNDGSIPDV